MFFLLLLCSLLSGCAQYHDLSPGWSHRGVQLSRLGFHAAETDGHTNFRLQPTSGVLVAYQLSEFPPSANTQRPFDQVKRSSLESKSDWDAPGTEVTGESLPAAEPGFPVSRSAHSVMAHWIAQAQAEVFRYYFADAQALEVSLPQAFSQARTRGLPTVFFVRLHQFNSGDWMSSECRDVDPQLPAEPQERQQTPMGVSAIAPTYDCQVSMRPSMQRVRLSFWLYDVQSQHILHTGHMNLQNLRTAKTPQEVLKLVSPSMQRLVQQWVAVSW